MDEEKAQSRYSRSREDLERERDLERIRHLQQESQRKLLQLQQESERLSRFVETKHLSSPSPVRDDRHEQWLPLHNPQVQWSQWDFGPDEHDFERIWQWQQQTLEKLHGLVREAFEPNETGFEQSRHGQQGLQDSTKHGGYTIIELLGLKREKPREETQQLKWNWQHIGRNILRRGSEPAEDDKPYERHLERIRQLRQDSERISKELRALEEDAPVLTKEFDTHSRVSSLDFDRTPRACPTLTLAALYAPGATMLREYNASFNVPLAVSHRTYGGLQLFGIEHDHSSFASCTESLRGARALVKSGTMTGGLHEWAYEAVERNLDAKPGASLSIHQAAGQTFKSAISHSYTLDLRDPDSLSGVYLKRVDELAGLGGGTSFYKSEMHMMAGRRISRGTSISVGLRSGLLWGLQGPPHFSDRFRLGAPFRSSGPRDNVDAVGGDVYWDAALGLVTPIPGKPEWPLRAHAWVTAARLDRLNRLGDAPLSALVTRPLVATGVGLTFTPYKNFRLSIGTPVSMLPCTGEDSKQFRQGWPHGVHADNTQWSMLPFPFVFEMEFGR
ncbi:hypothetical protein B0H15DRAFT_840402 [Mycena belliarum]|uniref:Bacterial surface antigen (D15) domain-containing protein n=1 Tax=Mycena belliarum TaxID=1033014 RepID=A0AAD6U964_9AGAR|nr:hypothetical protein B0H15DRAFT_840402 [Mycena belliae]